MNWEYYYQKTEDKLREYKIHTLEVDRGCRAFSTDEVFVYLKAFNEKEHKDIVDIIIKLDSKNIEVNRLKRDDEVFVYICFKYKI